MTLSVSERDELMLLQRSRAAAVAQVRRARLVLLLEDGMPWSAIKRELRCDSRFIATWGGRFTEQQLAGLFGRHPGRAPLRDPAKLEARVLERTLKHKPRDGSTHWSSRKLAAELNLPFITVQRIGRKHSVQPHRIEQHMVSNDPDFEIKSADVIGLYLNPPAHAAVFCADEKTAIQALDRKDRMLPLEYLHAIRAELTTSEDPFTGAQVTWLAQAEAWAAELDSLQRRLGHLAENGLGSATGSALILSGLIALLIATIRTRFACPRVPSRKAAARRRPLSATSRRRRSKHCGMRTCDSAG